MIISASRRTDIPAYYSDWFFNRLKEGFVSTRNPMNHSMVRRLCLAPENISGFVFWTKNPEPMLERLDELAAYMYCFQFSLTPYGTDIEPNLPDKKSRLLPVFIKLAGKIGPERVIWRYDPIFLSKKYTEEYHLRAFAETADALRGRTKSVVISFIETDCRCVQRNIDKLGLTEFTDETKIRLASALAEIARENGMVMAACATPLELSRCGIVRAKCIDGELFSKLLGRELAVKKDRNQRPGCGCAASSDIGAYNTCQNGCRYCYANYSPGSISGNVKKHDPQGEFLLKG